jgi:hypothetical protein
LLEEFLLLCPSQTVVCGRFVVVIRFVVWSPSVSAMVTKMRSPSLSLVRTMVLGALVVSRSSLTLYATRFFGNDSDLALLKIDFKNAFNLLERDAFVRAVSVRFPALERWTRWCYESSPLLIYDHARLFFSECGVQQGDPLGPLYFVAGCSLSLTKLRCSTLLIRNGTWTMGA